MPSDKKQTPMRMSDEDLAKCDRIADHFGLPSRAAAARYAVTMLDAQLDEDCFADRKKPAKKPKKGKS